MAKVTTCALGDPKLALFTTTSLERREPGDEPLVGSPVRATVGIEGISAREYTGYPSRDQRLALLVPPAT